MRFVSVGLGLNILGAGLVPLSRSLVTSYFPSSNIANLNTLIGIVGITGSIFAGPSIAWLFATGMKLKGAWLGLPYIGLAAELVSCFVALLFVHAPEADGAKVRAKCLRTFISGESDGRYICIAHDSLSYIIKTVLS